MSVDYHTTDTLSLEQFHTNYLKNNSPCMIAIHNIIHQWRSYHTWIQPNPHYDIEDDIIQSLGSSIESNNPCILQSIDFSTAQQLVHQSSSTSLHAPHIPNFTYLMNHYGTTTRVNVAQCQKPEYNTQMTRESALYEYMKKWYEYYQSSDAAGRGGNPRTYKYEEYMKDWHFMLNHHDESGKHDNDDHDERDIHSVNHTSRSTNQSMPIYTVPSYFTEDWLNEYYIRHTSSDYRFCYAGSQATFTPFHRDVFHSYSWSVNLCGYKLWVIVPPQYAHYLMDQHHNTIFDILRHERIEEQFPDASIGLQHALYIIQREHECIFIPSGYYHAVYNLTDCISINHNWLNGYCIEKIHQHIKHELQRVKHAMSGWDESITEEPRGEDNEVKKSEMCDKGEQEDELDSSTVQLILKAECGMNVIEYIDFIHYNATNITKHIESDRDIPPFMNEYYRLTIEKLIMIIDDLPASLDTSLDQGIIQLRAKLVMQDSIAHHK